MAGLEPAGEPQVFYVQLTMNTQGKSFFGSFTLMETTSPQSRQTVKTRSEPKDIFLFNGRKLTKSIAWTNEFPPQSVHFFSVCFILFISL